MPLYEAKCPKCGQFEFFSHTYREVETVACPECGYPARRLWSPGKGRPPFRSYYSEALSQQYDPVLIDSREKEKRLADKFGFERVQ